MRRLADRQKATGEPFGSPRTAAIKRIARRTEVSDMKKRRYVGTALVRLHLAGRQARLPNVRQRAKSRERFPARQGGIRVKSSDVYGSAEDSGRLLARVAVLPVRHGRTVW